MEHPWLPQKKEAVTVSDTTVPCRVQRINDICYNVTEPHKYAKQKLDLFVPLLQDDAEIGDEVIASLRSPKPVQPQVVPLTPLPCIIFIHGGGWKRFGRKTHANVGRAFAERGFVTAVISYRLSSVGIVDLVRLYTPFALIAGLATWGVIGTDSLLARGSVAAAFLVPIVAPLVWSTLWWVAAGCESVKHPDHVRDASLATAWVAAHASIVGGDPHRIYLVGHSAGGHIAALMALQPHRWLASALPDYPTRLRGVALLSGVYSARMLSQQDIVNTTVEDELASAFVRDVAGAQALLQQVAGGVEKLAGASSVHGSSRLIPVPEELHVAAIAAEKANADTASSPNSKWSRSWCGHVTHGVVALLLWPSSVFRKLYFLRAAFGNNASAWSAAFPCGADVRSGIAELRATPSLPPILLVNAQFDVGLGRHSDLLQAQLVAAGARYVERVTLRYANHFDYVVGMGRLRGSIALPLITNFFRQADALTQQVRDGDAGCPAAAAVAV